MTFLYKINKKGATAEGCITASDEAEAKAKLDAKFPKGSGVKVLGLEQVYVATIRNTRMSAFKGRPLAGACQGLPASEALKLVEFSPKKAAQIIKKTILSALANAKNNGAHGQALRPRRVRQDAPLLADRARLGPSDRPPHVPLQGHSRRGEEGQEGSEVIWDRKSTP